MTTLAINPADTVNAIVARYPEALPVLRQFGIDTCCGGALALSTVAEHHDIKLDELLAALLAVMEQQQ